MQDYDKGQAILEDLRQRRVRESETDEAKSRNANISSIIKTKPKEWNNIPIPVTELLQQLLINTKLQHKSQISAEK
jgi:hypothetical protein